VRPGGQASRQRAEQHVDEVEGRLRGCRAAGDEPVDGLDPQIAGSMPLTAAEAPAALAVPLRTVDETTTLGPDG
jgi:hypothetical protein